MNIDVLDHDATQKLAAWFNDRWNGRWCLDISKEVAQIIEESWAREELVLPYYVYLKMAYHLSRDARAGLTEFQIPRDFRGKLFEFQEAAFKIAAHHLNKRGGVVIGDVVGLGKTLMATCLARIFEDDHGFSTLIICPKNLVPMWQHHVDHFGMRAKVLSISRAIRELPGIPARFRITLIDESHNLRNREGKIYRAIHEYIAQSESRCILLTATPYNKTYHDLSNQLRLFVPEDKGIGIRPEKRLRELGEVEFIKRHQCPVRSLAAFEKSAYADDWRDLMRLYLVRRTRSFIQGNYAEEDPANGRKYLSVLDPTCGSGAFLFAALNILEPLYEACLDRMEGFLEELPSPAGRGAGGEGKPARKPSPHKYSDFRKTLAQVAGHPNQRYFVLKSIIIGNLFGVDIMEEAVEICKLRLFLKLVAQVESVDQIEPLPDIDFNIRAGNTLVGYTSLEQVRDSVKSDLGLIDERDEKALAQIEEDAEVASRAYRQFRQMQSDRDMDARQFHEAKGRLRQRLDSLSNKLDRFLSLDYRIDDTQSPKAFEEWQTSHHPFHWFTEFYAIMSNGGFDVVVGNPPYVCSSKVRKQYQVKGLGTEKCPDIYAWVLERNTQLLAPRSCSGMIVPLSLGFSGNFAACRQVLYDSYSENWFSSFGRIPSALFSFDVRVRNTIHVGIRTSHTPAHYTTRLHRWLDEERPHLFETLSYAAFLPDLWSSRIPKLNSTRLIRAFEACRQTSDATIASTLTAGKPRHTLFFKKTAYNWLNFCRLLPPCFDENGRPVPHTKMGDVRFDTDEMRDLAFLLLNGKIEFAFWVSSIGSYRTPRSSRSLARVTGCNVKRSKRKGNPNQPESRRRRVHRAGNEQLKAIEIGFSEAWQGKRMNDGKKRGPGRWCPRPRGFILPPWPGCPSLGCSPAEPNSVSPGNFDYTSEEYLATARNPKPAKRAHQVRRFLGPPVVHGQQPSVGAKNQTNRSNRHTPLSGIGVKEITSRRNPFTCRF